MKRYDAVLFDLLTALIDSWALWNRVAGTAARLKNNDKNNDCFMKPPSLMAMPLPRSGRLRKARSTRSNEGTALSVPQNLIVDV